MNKKTGNPLLTIFLTVFIDMLGITVVIPVFTTLFFEPTTAFFTPEDSNVIRSILFGWMIASFPIMQFFGAPVLGALSDKYGRKPILTITIFASLIGYLLFAYAIYSGILWLTFVSRAFSGFMGGNISIAQSAISDISTPEDKAKNFGLIGVAFGLGFILGPAIGGVLADDTILPWFGHLIPFLLTAILAFVNFVSVINFFPETLKKKKNTRINAFSGVQNLMKSFSDPRLRPIFIVVFCFSTGFAFFTQFYAVYLVETFGYEESDIGAIFAWIGVWSVITQAVIVRKLSGKVAPKKLLRFTFLTLAIGINLHLWPTEAWILFAIAPIVAISQGISSPNILSVVSSLGRDDEQGTILGINQSVVSFGAAAPPVIAGYLNGLNGDFPMMAGAAIIFIGWLFFIFLVKR